MGDAGLGLHFQQVEDGHPRRLAARARGGGDGDQRREGPGDWAPLADGRVYIGEEVCGVGCVEVRGLGGVDAGAAAHGDVAVESAPGREVDGLLERDVRRLDPYAVEGHGVDALSSEGVEGLQDWVAAREVGVGHDHDAARA